MKGLVVLILALVSFALRAPYLANNGGRANPTNLYVIWIGADDFQAGLTPQQTSATIETFDFGQLAYDDVPYAESRRSSTPSQGERGFRS